MRKYYLLIMVAMFSFAASAGLIKDKQAPILSTFMYNGDNYAVKAIVYNDGVSWGDWSSNGGGSGVVLATPLPDASGNEWYAPDYELTDDDMSVWEDRYAPFGTNTWANGDILADLYFRRYFTLNEPIDGPVVLACAIDDCPAEVYINGVLIASVQDANPDWTESAMWVLSDEQKAAILTDGTENVLAMHVHNDWGGSNADAGLYHANTPLPILITHNWASQLNNIVSVDLFNDGKKELFFAGRDDNFGNRHMWLLRNINGEWTEIPNPLNCADKAAYNICDFNGDTNMDLVLFEDNVPSDDEVANNSYYNDKGIYLGNGDGTFQKLDIEVVNGYAYLPDNFGEDFTNIYMLRSGAVADFNNDGLLDIVGIGRDQNNVVLLNQGIRDGVVEMMPIYFDDGVNEGYGEEQRGRSFDVGFVMTADFNNDGFADFVVSANNWDYRQNILALGDMERFTEVYLNDGTGTKFLRTYFGQNNPSVFNGGIAIADFNNDGFLDMYVSGDGGFFPGSPKAIELTGNDWDGYWERAIMCLNDGTGHFNPMSPDDFEPLHIRGLNSVANVAHGYDWNGDGLIDVTHQGWCPDLGVQTGFVWTARPDGTFDKNIQYPGGSESSTAFADWDGDGIKDLITIGYCADRNYVSHIYNDGRNFIVVKGEGEGYSVAAPRAVSVETLETNKVLISWTPAEGAPHNTTYELYIKKEDGSLLGNCRAYIEGENEGLRKTEEFGNLGTVTSIVYSLPDGKYTIGVQAVNGRRDGSKFTTKTFTLRDGVVCSIVLDESSSAPIAAGTYSDLTLKRTFAAGWNTLCLPFEVNSIEGLLGEGAKAYEFCKYEDGELGFAPAASISSGVPYVVYVPAGIAEDIVLEDIDIEEAGTASSSVLRSSAYFRGTYVPVGPNEWTKEATTDIIYGLTADGMIQPAGPDASIKGFRAYFDLPIGAEVKALTIEDNATDIDNLNDNVNANDAIYKQGSTIVNLLGQRLSMMQRGVNISNGKKILK
ncbi:MAG: VCBS repeat-containing protein [Bacteroidaceae bacterium]|nr:VCBS repeat-containing protein [Bacteroidaceae bacterium]